MRLIGGTLTNGAATDTAAEIVGAYGLSVTGAAATVRNFGSILGMSGGAIYIGNVGGGGSVSLINGAYNDTTALIMGGAYGLLVNAAAATVTNYGTITGTTGTALTFSSASDLLIIETGSSLIGAVQGGGGTLELASGAGTITGLGTSFSGFGSYVIESGGRWTLSGTNSVGAGTTLVNHGTMSVGGMLSDRGSLTNVGSINGGSGGVALKFVGGALTNGGAITAGAGGAGGDGGTAVQVASGALTNSGAITGGAGGATGVGGVGGDGGSGVYTTNASGLSNSSTGQIKGGAGGGGGYGGYGGTAIQMAGGSFTNSGAVTGGGGGAGSQATGGAGGAGVYLSGGGALTNGSIGLINGGAGGGGVNGGAGGAAVQMVSGAFTNSGTITGGVGGAGSSSGAAGGGGAGAYVASGGVLTNSTTGLIKGGSGGGGGTGGAGGAAVQLAGGSLTNSGTIIGGQGGLGSQGTNGAGGAGVYLLGGGNLTNKGKLAGGAGGGGGPTAAGIVVSGAGTIDNIGTISGGTYSVDITGAGGVLKAETGSVFIGEAEGGGGKLELGSGSGTITNMGATGTISGAEKLTFSGFGTYQIDAGISWTLAGTNTLAAGDTLSDVGKVSCAGAVSVSGTISGAGNLTVTGGTTTIGAGAKATVATLSLGAGTTILNESLTYQGAFAESKPATLTLGNNDRLSLTGTQHLAGLINGAGTMSVSNASIGGFDTDGTAVLIDTGTVSQQGAVVIGSGSGSSAGLVIAAGASWTILSETVILRGSANSSIDIEGTFIGSCPGGPTSIANATNVGGVIEAQTGVLIFISALTGTGAVNIDGGTTFEVGSSVASTLTANFTGPTATLALRHSAISLGASSFGATITGFAVGDTINLQSTAATGASVNGNDQLVIVNTTAGGTKTVASLQLTGNYVGDTFTITSDGDGGTNVAIAGTPPVAQQTAHAFVAAMAGFAPSPSPAAMVSSTAADVFRPTVLVPRAQQF